MVFNMKLGKTIGSLFLAGSLTFGCATFKPYTTKEKIWLGTAVAGAVSDIATTKHGLDKGFFSEKSPIMGNNPKLEELIIGKTILFGIFYVAGELDPDNRKNYYKILSAFGFAGATWNFYNIQKNK